MMETEDIVQLVRYEDVLTKVYCLQGIACDMVDHDRESVPDDVVEMIDSLYEQVRMLEKKMILLLRPLYETVYDEQRENIRRREDEGREDIDETEY